MGATTGIATGVRIPRHHEPIQALTPVLTPVSEPVKPFIPTLPPVTPIDEKNGVATGGEVLPYEWRLEWKRTSEGRRAIFKRLWVFENSKWRKASREDIKLGSVTITEINKKLKSFSANGEAKITKIGEQDVRNAIQQILNRNN